MWSRSQRFWCTLKSRFSTNDYGYFCIIRWHWNNFNIHASRFTISSSTARANKTWIFSCCTGASVSASWWRWWSQSHSTDGRRCLLPKQQWIRVTIHGVKCLTVPANASETHVRSKSERGWPENNAVQFKNESVTNSLSGASPLALGQHSQMGSAQRCQWHSSRHCVPSPMRCTLSTFHQRAGEKPAIAGKQWPLLLCYSDGDNYCAAFWWDGFWQRGRRILHLHSADLRKPST